MSSLTALKIPPTNASSRPGGVYNSGDTITFTLPPQKVTLESLTVTGYYKITSSSPAKLTPLVGDSATNWSYTIFPPAGHMSIMATSEVLKAYSLNTLDKVTQVPLLITSISLTRHPSTFTAINWGTGVDPMLRFTAGRVRGYGTGSRFSVSQAGVITEMVQYQHVIEFAFRPCNGIFNNRGLNLETLNGLTLQYVVSRVSDCCTHYAPFGWFTGANTQVNQPPTAYGLSAQNDLLANAGNLLVTAPNTQVLSIVDISLLVVLSPASKSKLRFQWPTVEVFRQDKPATNRVLLSIPIGLADIRSVSTYVFDQYRSNDLAFPNVGPLSVKRSDFHVTANGVPAQFRYSTLQPSESLRISDCTTNTIMNSALNDQSARSLSSRKIARGTLNEITYNVEGTGTSFKNVAWQYMWLDKLQTFIPDNEFLGNGYTTSQDSVNRQEEYYNINSIGKTLPFYTAFNVTNLPANPDCDNILVLNPANPATAPVGFFPTAFNMKDIYHGSRPDSGTFGALSVVNLLSTINTLTLSSDASSSEVEPTGPDDFEVPLDLQFSEVATESAVERVVDQHILGRVLPWSNPNQALLEFKLPTSGFTGDMFLRFQLFSEHTQVQQPGDTAISNLLWTNDDYQHKLFTRLQPPSTVGDAWAIRFVEVTLPNGTLLRCDEVVGDLFLNTYGSCNKADLNEQEFTSKRSDGWVVGLNGHYTDFLHHRSYDYAGSAWQSALPYSCSTVQSRGNQTIYGKYTDYKAAAKVYCINISKVCDILDKVRIPNISNQTRYLRVGLDLRGIAAAYQPCGVGNEAMGSYNPVFFVPGFQNPNAPTPLNTNIPPALQLILDSGYTPRLYCKVAYFNPIAQDAIQNKFATEGMHFQISHYDRFYEKVDTTALPKTHQINIGGYNPPYVLIQHQHLQQTHGDIYFYAPDELENTRANIQTLGTSYFSSHRDGMLAVSYNECVLQKNPDTVSSYPFNPEYDVFIDNSLVSPFPLGSAAVNALNYTLVHDTPLIYPDWMISDINRGLFVRPTAVISGLNNQNVQIPNSFGNAWSKVGAYNANGGAATQLQNCLTWMDYDSSVLVTPSLYTQQASRGLMIVPIFSQFQNGTVLKITRRQADVRHSYFAVNNTYWPTASTYADAVMTQGQINAQAIVDIPNYLLRTTILHTPISIHVTATDSTLKYEYASGKFIST